MYRSICTVVVALFTLVLSPMALIELAGQEFFYTGTRVEATLVRTDHSPVVIFDPKATTFSLLPSSTLQAHVNPGDSDLFVFELVAECQIGDDADQFDAVQVEARLNGLLTFALGGGGVAFLQPQDVPSDGRLCSGPGRQPVSKSWFVTLRGGESGTNWTFTIWWRLRGVHDPNLFAGLINRVVRLTRYD
jgi:hypothetical protein